MIYSVWNQGTGLFDYHEDDRQQTTLNVEKPGHLQTRALGSTVEQAAWPLPADAQPVGSGAVPIGRIASRSSGRALGDDGDPSGLVTVGMLLISAAVAWKVLQPKKRRRR